MEISRTRARNRTAQRGMVLIIMATMMILASAWFAVSALAKLVVGPMERNNRTGLALQEGKKALLAYVAQKAFDTAEPYPGSLPCPEPTGVVGSATVVAGTSTVYDGMTFDQAY